MKLKTFSFIMLLVLVGAVLAACGTTEPEVVEVTRVVTETQVVEGEAVEVTRIETEVVEVTRVVTEVEQVEVVVEATPEPVTRTGAWLDTIVFIEEFDQAQALARLQSGDVDIFANDVGGQAAVEAIRDAGNITTVVQYGLYDELFFNNGACADGSLNPFTSKPLREAMNYAIDRNYIADELYVGQAVPKITYISEASADRGRFAPEIRALEAKYAYDLEKAREVVNAEMEAFGAELVDGVWNYNGEPVTLVILIRTEDTRLQIGNYFANNLEELGFLTERVERVSRELSPIWASGDPTLCEWNVYTGAWSQSQIARQFEFEQMYFPRGYGVPSWQVIVPNERLSEISLALLNNDFSSIEEYEALVREGLPLSLQDSPRIWVTSRTTLDPRNDRVQVSADLAGGVQGHALWSRTIRFRDQVGGTMRVAIDGVYIEPWNPIGGSNWVMDAMVQNGISEPALYFDPNTGLQIPNRVEKIELEIIEGFPTTNNGSDWIDLSFSAEIPVPEDAWARWDATNQVFLTAGEYYTEPQTARMKSTVYYEEDLYDTITWHDGSPFSVADIVMAMILNFDLAQEDSPYYDVSQVPGYEQDMSSFKAVRIASVDPLVIETWRDNPQLDAELSPQTWWPYSTYPRGDAAWHNMSLALRSQASGQAVFSDELANELEVERMSWISGPVLEILASELVSATAENFIPFAPTLGQYVTAEDAAARYSNLAEFARRYGHYWLGTGVYYLQGLFPIEGQAVLQRYAAHPDPADKFAAFAAAKLATVDVDGETRVGIGDEAVFDVYLDFEGEAYPMDEVDNVAYLLFDATGAQVAQGAAEAVEDGLWTITLSSDVTGALVEGSNSLEIVVVSKVVALPSLGSFQFVTE